MLLKQLSNKDKEYFWKLTNYLMMADGKIADEEIAIMKEYAEEMEYEKKIEKVSKEEVEKVVENLKSHSPREKRIIYFELLALAFSDLVFADEEKMFLDEVGEKFGILENERNEMIDIVNGLTILYRDIYQFINKK
ncbi:hypothetical protein [Fusobacterium sp.]|uniref:hypothetical protein n=1 Tax=Fusobacterium sp. TaxID=68766 RepID=UPI00396C63F6